MEPSGTRQMDQCDVIVVGGGLAGLVAAAELADRGKRVILHRSGARAFSRRAGVLVARWSVPGRYARAAPDGNPDSRELALNDWMGSAQFDRKEDYWPRKWAEAYVDFAAGEMRPWLHAMGMRWFPGRRLGRAGRVFANGHGNSVPRFH
jgi:predicted oxidoreductase